MSLLPERLLWLALATAGTPATPAATPAEAVMAELSASPVHQRLTLGPLRRSLQTVRASLSIPASVCPDVDSQAEALPEAPHRSKDVAGPACSVACLAAAQVTKNQPTGPSWSQWVQWVGLSLALALITWLLSKS